MSSLLGNAVGGLQDRVVAATSSLFSHGPQPLARTVDHPGDPGLLGPDSVSWRVIGDTTAFVGGIRALLVQTAHPEVVAGVDQHSTYRDDPLGRLSRTAVYVTETTYGARPEVEAAVAAVRSAHRPVRGTSDRGVAYSAGHPGMAAWVHNVLTDSFLVAYQTYGPEPLPEADADAFVVEQAEIGALLSASPLPTTAAELAAWVSSHPDLAPTAAQAEAVEFLCDPPLSAPVKFGYRRLLHAALATIPTPVASILGVDERRGSEAIGRATVTGLRWALGSSPSWHLALVRCGAPVPPGRFRQPLPPAARRLVDERARGGD